MDQRLPMAFAALVFLAAPPLRAQERGTESDRQACTSDVFRLCLSSVPNEDAIVACLNRRIADLSPDCQKVIEPDPKKRRALPPR